MAYGVLSAQRQAATKGESKDKQSPGLGSYIDVAAALVPAEILAANAALLPIMSTSGEDESGASVTTITEPGTLKLVFWLSIVSCIVLYVAAQLTRAKKERAKAGNGVGVAKWGFANYLRMFIPAGAYVGWTMLQKSTAFDAIDPGMSQSLRLTLAVFAAIALSVVAKALSDQADGQDSGYEEPQPAEPPADCGGGMTTAGPTGSRS
jgi:hypothetical protein